MPIDTSIYGNLLATPKSVAQYDMENQQQQGNALALMLQRQNLEQSMQAAAERNALRAAFAGGLDPTTQAGRSQLYQTAPTMAPGILKTVQDQMTAEAKAQLDRAQAGHATAQTGQITAQTLRDDYTDAAKGVMANPTPEAARAAVLRIASKYGTDPTDELVGLRQLQTPAQIKQWAAAHALKAEQMLPKTDNVDLGGTRGFTSTDPVTGQVTMTGQQPITLSANTAATNEAHLQGIGMQQAGENNRAGQLNQLQREAGRTQIVVDPNMGVLAVDKGKGTFKPVVGPGGEQVPGEQQVASQKLSSQLSESIKMARKLIPQATASGAGSMVDNAAGFVGYATPGANAAAQLDTLAGWMTSNVPRMQGPQSDKDTLLYRQMAAQVGDRTKPASTRLAALSTLERLQQKYADINKDMSQGSAPKEPASAPPPPSKPVVVNY